MQKNQKISIVVPEKKPGQMEKRTNGLASFHMAVTLLVQKTEKMFFQKTFLAIKHNFLKDNFPWKSE